MDSSCAIIFVNSVVDQTRIETLRCQYPNNCKPFICSIGRVQQDPVYMGQLSLVNQYSVTESENRLLTTWINTHYYMFHAQNPTFVDLLDYSNVNFKNTNIWMNTHW